MGKNHTSGGKATSSHTTYIDAVGPVLKFLGKSSLVKKYSLGMITNARCKDRRIKVSEILGGVRLVVYGNIALQELHVYVESVMEFKKNLQTKLGKEYIIQENGK